jgi:two-component system sensor histidine kinase PilS (NtrC family)
LFAKPPVGKIEKIELESTLTETVKLFEKGRADTSGVSIASELFSNVWIEMDPMHLRQVIWNLLLNAAEAIESGGLIRIKTYPLKHDYAGIEISDNGHGIKKESMQSIFDPFFTTKPSGTGLGLSIVHRILESYNTWLDVESKVDQGTKFTFKLKRIGPPT